MPNTTKHCFSGPESGDMLKRLVKMAEAVVGGSDQLRERPLVSFITCPVSPLKLPRDCCEVIIESARSGMLGKYPVHGPGRRHCPMTLAGALVTHNAEILSGVVLNQLTCKGSPVMYGCSTTAMEMKTGDAVVGTPELAMVSAAAAEMAQYYLLPSWVGGG